MIYKKFVQANKNYKEEIGIIQSIFAQRVLQLLFQQV